METVQNLCANRKVAHKNHAIGAWCSHGGHWWKKHKSGHRKKILLARNEARCRAFCAHLCQMSKHEIYIQKEIWAIHTFNNAKWAMGKCPNCLNGMDAILVVVDRFSKLAKMAPIKTIATTFDLVKLFFDMWVRHHMMLQFIISVRYAKFTTSFWKHLFQKLVTKLLFNMTFHP